MSAVNQNTDNPESTTPRLNEIEFNSSQTYTPNTNPTQDSETQNPTNNTQTTQQQSRVSNRTAQGSQQHQHQSQSQQSQSQQSQSRGANTDINDPGNASRDFEDMESVSFGDNTYSVDEERSKYYRNQQHQSLNNNPNRYQSQGYSGSYNNNNPFNNYKE